MPSFSRQLMPPVISACRFRHSIAEFRRQDWPTGAESPGRRADENEESPEISADACGVVRVIRDLFEIETTRSGSVDIVRCRTAPGSFFSKARILPVLSKGQFFYHDSRPTDRMWLRTHAAASEGEYRVSLPRAMTNTRLADRECREWRIVVWRRPRVGADDVRVQIQRSDPRKRSATHRMASSRPRVSAMNSCPRAAAVTSPFPSQRCGGWYVRPTPPCVGSSHAGSSQRDGWDESGRVNRSPDVNTPAPATVDGRLGIRIVSTAT